VIYFGHNKIGYIPHTYTLGSNAIGITAWLGRHYTWITQHL